MSFDFERPTGSKSPESEPGGQSIDHTDAEPTPAPELNRRSFLVGAAALAGSPLLAEKAEAGPTGREELFARREQDTINRRTQADRTRQTPYPPNQRAETNRNEQGSRIEKRGAMEYAGFSPSEHEQKLLDIRLFRLVPNAVSIQIALKSESEFKTENLTMSILNQDGTTLFVVGSPVFTEPGVNKNMLLINRLLERLEQTLSTK